MSNIDLRKQFWKEYMYQTKQAKDANCSTIVRLLRWSCARDMLDQYFTLIEHELNNTQWTPWTGKKDA